MPPLTARPNLRILILLTHKAGWVIVITFLALNMLTSEQVTLQQLKQAKMLG